MLVNKKYLVKSAEGVYNWELDPDIFWPAWMQEAQDWYAEMNSWQK